MRGRGPIVALSAVIIVLLVGSLVMQGYYGSKTARATEQVARAIEAQASARPQGPTTVYAQSVQNNVPPGDVPFYDVPSPGLATTQVLPAFTQVDMLCWVNTGEERWFYVRVVGQNPTVRVGTVGAVQAEDTHQQIEVGGCQKQ